MVASITSAYHSLVNTGEVTDANEDDLHAIERARSDPRAFGPIYERYAEPIYLFCYRRLHDPDLASDAASLVFLRAVTAIPAFQPRRSDAGSTVRAWLFTIARNIVTDSHRRNRHHLSLDQPDAPDFFDRAASPEDQAIDTEETMLVAQLLAELPARQRAVVELRLAGLRTSEIARATANSEAAVKALQARAYRDLRDRLERHPHLLTREHRS